MAISGALAPLIFLSSFGRCYPAIGNVLAFVVPVAVAGLFGLFNGWFITRFQVQPIVGHAGHVHRRARHRAGDDQRQSADVQEPDVSVHRPWPRLWRACQVIIMLALVAAAAWTLRRTLFGRQILSVGGNERAARLAGVPVAAVKRWVYAISGLCAGIAGLVVVSINSSSDANLVGLGMELDAIAAVAVGGTPFTGGQATVVGSLHRRAADPARALHPARQRRARRGRAGGEGRDHRRRGVVAAAEHGVVSAQPATLDPGGSFAPFGLGGPTARADRAGPPHSVRRAALRSFPRRVQRAERPALQFDVRADRPRHVLRHHDGGHRSFGRNDGGVGERRLGDAVAVWASCRDCSAASAPGSRSASSTASW